MKNKTTDVSLPPFYLLQLWPYYLKQYAGVLPQGGSQVKRKRLIPTVFAIRVYHGWASSLLVSSLASPLSAGVLASV